MLVFGYLTGNQVILVVTGYRHEHVRPAGADLGKRSRLAAVAAEADAAQFVGNGLTDACVLFQYQHLVTLIKQRLEQVITQATSADDYNIHAFTSRFRLLFSRFYLFFQ